MILVATSAEAFAGLVAIIDKTVEAGGPPAKVVDLRQP
jgi:hypothetical protein